MKVLVTGAGGEVTPGVIRSLEKSYALKLLDLASSKAFAHHEWAVGSILDQMFLENAVEDVEAVVHCAVVKKTPGHEVTTEQFFDVNVKGLYFLLETCFKFGVRRFVHVSSMSLVIGHWDAGGKITVNSPYTTQGRYSLTKMLQEQICRHMAYNSDMTIVALRLWVPCEGVTVQDQSGRELLRPYHPGLIDTEDLGEACRLAIERHMPSQFEIFHVAATQEARQRFDAERTRAILGFEAKEDFSSLL